MKALYVKIIAVISIIIVFIIPNIVNANVVEYRGEAEGLIIIPDDFFIDFGELMPGDTKEGKALIKNNSKEQIEIFFKTKKIFENENYDVIDNSLLEKINLKIKLKNSKEEKEIYDGNLGAESLSNNYISLGTYEKGFDGEFIFEIEVPKTLKNAYALSSTEVKWIFYVTKESDKNDEKVDDNNSTNNINNGNTISNNTNLNNTIKSNDNGKNNENKKDNNIVRNIIKNVKTGDYIYYIVGLIIILAIINIIIIFIRRRKKDEK